MNPTQQQQPSPQSVEQQHQQKQQQTSTGSTTTTTPSSSYKQVTIRQNFSDEAENLINQLINNVFYVCYTCSSMAYYFDREEIGLFGMANFFRWCARESYQRCRLLMDYIVVRGGVVQFETIKKPEKTEWGTPIEALEYCLNLKKVINQQVLKVHTIGCEQIDPHLTDFLETMVLRPLVEFIRKVGVLLANVERAGPKLGEYQFNKDIELYLERIMRETKLSHANLPITAVGAPLPFAPPTIGGGISSPVSPLGPSSYLPNVGFSTPSFNLADVINLISNFGLQQQYGRTRIM